jgi:demethylmenaquinone methyltransferase / 2-methoxy-6-polyprenyl-1,4-benzoquinol methylase
MGDGVALMNCQWQSSAGPSPAGRPAPAAAWRGASGPLFDRNARRYDAVNCVITFGMDRRWRSWLVEQAGVRPGSRALDACAGTGLVGLELAGRGARVTLLDASPEMLAIAARRAAAAGLDVEVLAGDLEMDAPPAMASFDVITMAFGLRYFADPAAALGRLREALAPGGRLLLVDAVCPPRDLIGRAGGVYFFQVAPRVATVLAGRGELYQSLTASVRALGNAAAVRALIDAAGLRLETQRSWVGGLVYAVVTTAVGGR